MFDLSGRKALVTGASGGIGEEIARMLHAQGAVVGLHGTRVEKLEALANTLGERVQIFPANLSDRAEVKALGEKAEADLGGVDILVANAGGPPAGTFASTAYDAYLPALQLNLLSTVAMCQAAVPPMVERGWGRVVGITSASVRQPSPTLILSNTARAGVTAFLKTLATEVAPSGVTVNTVQPGLHATPRLAELYGDHIARAAAAVPVGTLGDPDDFGATVAFLCSEHARFLTGASIPVDGGATGSLQ